jgi:hypothetical protein
MSFQAWDCGIDRGGCAVGRLIRRAVRQRVDEAVVILKNVHHHLEAGLNPIEAALAAQDEGADWRASSRSKAPFRGDVS